MSNVFDATSVGICTLIWLPQEETLSSHFCATFNVEEDTTINQCICLLQATPRYPQLWRPTRDNRHYFAATLVVMGQIGRPLTSLGSVQQKRWQEQGRVCCLPSTTDESLFLLHDEIRKVLGFEVRLLPPTRLREREDVDKGDAKYTNVCYLIFAFSSSALCFSASAVCVLHVSSFFNFIFDSSLITSGLLDLSVVSKCSRIRPHRLTSSIVLSCFLYLSNASWFPRDAIICQYR